MSDKRIFHDDKLGSSNAILTNEMVIDTKERIGALLDLMPNAIPMGLLIHQKQGILFANNEASSLFGIEVGHLKGLHLFDFTSNADKTAYMPKFLAAFNHDHLVYFEEIELTADSGMKRIVNITIVRLDWQGTDVVQVMIQDITELKAQELELKRLVMTDALTGAFNRRFFMEHSEKLVQDARAKGEPLTLLLMDIDKFKAINDSYGHAAGDEALKLLVTLWQANTRQIRREDGHVDGQLARLGGEEFSVVFVNNDVDYARRVADRFRTVLEMTKINFGSVSFHQTVSMGLTQLQDSDEGMDDIYYRADQALYEAKEEGRNRLCIK